MGSFIITNSRTCLKHLCPLLRRPLYHQRAPQKNNQPSNHPYCTKGERRPSEFHGTKHRDFTPRNRTSIPKSVFAAGNARRTAEILKRKSGADQDRDQDPDQVSTGSLKGRAAFTAQIPDRALSVSEWRDLKSSSSRPERFELRMMEGMLADTEADISVAKSLLNYVAAENGTLPYELLLKYLALCVSGGHHSEVSDVYDIMKSCFKTLDTGAYSLFVKGLSHTERWREALIILEDIKKVITPSSRNYGDAVTGAVLHGDRETAWRLYGELMDQGLMPNQETWRCLFESGVSQRAHKDELLAILTYMRENQIYPEEKLVRSIKAWFESLPDENWRGKFTSVDPGGVCRSCGTELESIQLTEEEYNQLKHRVMEDVIEGRDVFNKTTPEELESFKSFVQKRPAFDVVIDGLNVANITPKCVKSETLLAVVSALQGLNVLVLGRKHMQQPSRNWNRHNMNQIKQKAHCFFTENISEDDPFLLYAALHSGNHCNFVSRDLMRDHKACLPDSATRRLFFKWQRGHQLVLSNFIPGKKIRFQRTSRYDTIVQSHGKTWHVPYDEDGGERSTYEVPQRWLCLSNDV
ncbi:mitochondrial ribonuclease P catalytic subunit isoform X2 [Pangasianodon hypophthalmus]|uniref:mitochondrial ribonuclease P catalytic subunit isoform X2 n=1 Tax=Pangasianodon hypophthalmus TaxID=310915 RepID=UPI002306FB20|nr:mitochondrial ribonuclease P catalytic subunit isoform X2 [Pangasianodon hypophthalmus]